MARARKRAGRRAAAKRRPVTKRARAAKRSPATARRPVVPRRKPPAPRRVGAKPSAAELQLLALAREVAGLDGDAWPRAVHAVAAAYASDGELPRAVHRAWLASRGDKTATLALAWAREQLRLGLEGVIAATPPSARGVLALPAETLAWLVLAACEALAYEPPSAAPDRVRLLLELTGRGAPPA
jgi:hypothetical protein